MSWQADWQVNLGWPKLIQYIGLNIYKKFSYLIFILSQIMFLHVIRVAFGLTKLTESHWISLHTV